MRALKMGGIVASHQKLTTTSGEQSLKLIFGNRKSYQRIQHQSFYSYMTFEANWNSEKLSKWVSHELTTNQKCCHFEVSPSLTLCNNEPFLDWTVMCNEEWIYMTTDEDQLSGWTEKLLQNTSPELKLQQKKGRGHCLVICWPSDPLQLSESRRNCYIWEVCSLNQHDAPKTAIPAVSIVQQGPVLFHGNDWPHIEQPTLQKLNELGYEVLPQTPYSPNLSPTDCHFYKHLNNFLQEKCFPRVLLWRHELLCYRNKQTYLSLAKMCWL